MKKRSLFIVVGLILVTSISVYKSCGLMIPNSIQSEMLSIVDDVVTIDIPGFYYKPHNPGVLKLDDGYLMVFRCRSSGFSNFVKGVFQKEARRHFLGVVHINKSFKVISPVQILPLEEEWSSQDIRLIKVDEKIYGVVSSKKVGENHANYMCLVELKKEGEHFLLQNRLELSFPEGSKYSKKNGFTSSMEKNWTPFLYEGELHFVYSITPMVVVKPDLTTGECALVSESPSSELFSYKNKISSPKGGTTVINSDLGNLGFYHTTMPAPSLVMRVRNFFNLPQKSQKEMKLIYFFGAYLFDDKPPFAIKHSIKVPITGKALYKSKRKIIFPTALIEDQENFLIFAGIDDTHIQVLKISKINLEKKLISSSV